MLKECTYLSHDPMKWGTSLNNRVAFKHLSKVILSYLFSQTPKEVNFWEKILK